MCPCIKRTVLQTAREHALACPAAANMAHLGAHPERLIIRRRYMRRPSPYHKYVPVRQARELHRCHPQSHRPHWPCWQFAGTQSTADVFPMTVGDTTPVVGSNPSVSGRGARRPWKLARATCAQATRASAAVSHVTIIDTTNRAPRPPCRQLLAGRGDHAEVAAAAADGPGQVRVLTG
jgi:hypothetical protein